MFDGARGYLGDVTRGREAVRGWANISTDGLVLIILTLFASHSYNRKIYSLLNFQVVAKSLFYLYTCIKWQALFPSPKSDFSHESLFPKNQVKMEKKSLYPFSQINKQVDSTTKDMWQYD